MKKNLEGGFEPRTLQLLSISVLVIVAFPNISVPNLNIMFDLSYKVI